MTTIIFTVLIAIIWLAVSILLTRTMNDYDGDAIEWLTFPLPLKILVVIAAPILYLIWERHIFETIKKSEK